MKSQEAHVHHYVPRWYQRGFLKGGQSQFYYLDMHPESVEENGHRHRRRDLLRWGPDKCFWVNDLYTVKFGNWLSNDEIERRFFGEIDNIGKEAVQTLANFEGLSRSSGKDLNYLPVYMDAQRMRTPRGLARFQALTDIRDANQTLWSMQKLFQMHTTMWTEGVWEVVRARKSPTKFIVTDEPVTFYNAKVFPQSKVGKYPGDVGLDKIGTRTIFPLNIDTCLLISHVQFIRNPWANVLDSRLNARAYQRTMMSLLDIQFGRELTEDEVLRINLIMKCRTTRYMAAAEEEWLYPEKHVSVQYWPKLDEDWFLFPNLWKVLFNSGIVAGFEGGGSLALDEYGYRPGDPRYDDKGRREAEWDLHEKAKRAWARRRAGKSIAFVDRQMGREGVDDEMMEEYLWSVGIRSNREVKTDE